MTRDTGPFRLIRMLDLLGDACRAHLAGDSERAAALTREAATIEATLRADPHDAGHLTDWERELRLEHGVEPPAHRVALAALCGHTAADMGGLLLHLDTQTEHARDRYLFDDDAAWVRLPEACRALAGKGPIMLSGRALELPRIAPESFRQGFIRLRREYHGLVRKTGHRDWPVLRDGDFLDNTLREQLPWLPPRLCDRMRVGDWLSVAWLQQLARVRRRACA